MKYQLAVVALIAPLAILACGGDGGGVPEELANVCTETASAAADEITVDEPDNGEEVRPPIRVSGEIVAPDGRFWISVVGADGQHIIDYPGNAEASEDPVPFTLEVPFSVFEDTPACLWVYRENVEDPQDALRIPIELVPEDTEE